MLLRPPRRSNLAPWLVALVLLACLARATPARASPGFYTGEDALEDPLADGDLDAEDHAALRLDRRPGSSDLHGASWVSLVGFERQLLSGRNDVGGIVVVGLALDRIDAGRIHRIGDPPTGPAAPDPPADAQVRLAAPRLARQCVAAAWRSAGLGSDDARIDALDRALESERAAPGDAPARDAPLGRRANTRRRSRPPTTPNFYDAVGANLVLELRLTWRLDRLLYAGDEPTLERVRLERLDARTRARDAHARGPLRVGARPGRRRQAARRHRPRRAEAQLRDRRGRRRPSTSSPAAGSRPRPERRSGRPPTGASGDPSLTGGDARR